MIGIYRKLSLFFSLVAAICTTLAIVLKVDLYGFLSGVFWIIAVVFDYLSSHHADTQILILKEKVKKL